MKKNEELQKDVQDAIKWEPLLHAAEIGVIAQDGVITLTGVVDTYAKKSEAENAAKNVAGVKAVVEKIEIQFGSLVSKSGNEIAIDILNSFKWNWEIPNEKVKVKVEDGWVTLEGEVQWNFQKEAAKNAVKNITGVKGVTNVITIKAETNNDVEKKDIELALLRNWAIKDKDIEVNVSGSKVTLKGIVHSLYQKDQAGRIAWNAPGVLTLDNELVIE